MYISHYSYIERTDSRLHIGGYRINNYVAQIVKKSTYNYFLDH